MSVHREKQTVGGMKDERRAGKEKDLIMHNLSNLFNLYTRPLRRVEVSKQEGEKIGLG